MQTNTIKQKGFTLIELLVVAPLVILLIGVMIGYISAITGDGLKSQQKNALAYETQNAFDDIDTTTAQAISFEVKTSGLQSPQGSSDSANDFWSNSNTLVLKSIALSGNSSNNARTPIYSETGPNNSCNTSSAPYTYFTVYFLNASTLYKRIILSNSPRCATPQQKNSCSPAKMQAIPPPSTAICQVEDEKLADNVTSFDIAYLGDDSKDTTFPFATTVKITLNTQKNVAGSLLTYSATMRTKKQNSTQSATPQKPKVTGNNLADPDTYVCNWDAAANVSDYNFQYKIGNDNWVQLPAPIGTSSKEIDITSKRGQKLECQVTANLTNGTTLAYDSLTINEIPLWTTPTLNTPWVRYDNYYAGEGFTKTSSGMVVLKGLIKSGTAPGTAFQLPPKYRPEKSLLFQTSAAVPGGASEAGRVDVTPDGNVYVQGTANAWVSLAGINFMPSQYQPSFIAPTFAGNGWRNYDNGWQQAGYMQDSMGRLRIQGLVGGGPATDNTLIFSIPSGLRPAQYEHVASRNTDAFGGIGNNPGNGVVAKGGGNAYLSTNTLTYPASFSGWTNLTPIAPWVQYTGYTTPKFTKAADGLVMLKGFFASGSAGTYMANIPGNLKLCPKERHVYAAGASGAYGRIDVEPGTPSGGCGISFQQGNSGWVSFDAISWIGEI